MAQRITRAKAKIKAAAHPLPGALRPTTSPRGSTACSRCLPRLQRGLSRQRGRPTRCAPTSRTRRSGSRRLVRELLPDDGEVAGLLALMLLTEARRPARVSAHGELVTLDQQDRGAWDRALIAEGHALVRASGWRRGEPPGRYQLLAAINAVHTDAPTPGTPTGGRSSALYGQLVAARPVTGRGPQPRDRGRRARRPAGRPRPGRRARQRPRRLPRLPRHPRRPAAPARAAAREAREAYDRAIGLSGNSAEMAPTSLGGATSSHPPEDGDRAAGTIEAVTAPRRPGLLTDLGAAALALVLVGIAGMLGKWQYDAWQAHRDAEARDLTGIDAGAAGRRDGQRRPVPRRPDLGSRWRWRASGCPTAASASPTGREPAGARLLGRDPAAVRRRRGARRTRLGARARRRPAGRLGRGGGRRGWLQPPRAPGVVDDDPTDDVFPEMRVADAVQHVDADLSAAYVVSHATPAPGCRRPSSTALPTPSRTTARPQPALRRRVVGLRRPSPPSSGGAGAATSLELARRACPRRVR